MKRILPVLLIMILLLSGCKGAEKNSLDKSDWNFSRIIEIQTGVVVFSNEKNSAKYNTAKVIDLSFTADESKITIKDSATGNEWALDYAENKTAKTNNTEGTIYDITYTSEEKTIKGYATTGIANLSDVSKYTYIVITLGGYELHFNDMTETKIA